MLQSLDHGHLFRFLLLVPGLKLQSTGQKERLVQLHMFVNTLSEQRFHILLVLFFTPVLNDSLHDVVGGQIAAAVQDAENPSLLRLLRREKQVKNSIYGGEDNSEMMNV